VEELKLYGRLEAAQSLRVGKRQRMATHGASTLKTYLVQKGKPFLKAENPKYPQLFPAEELTIQGVFRALIRRAKE
jgi:SOS-response transcriptional repressor LexA